MALQKAKIQFENEKKLMSESIDVLFNPPSLMINSSNDYVDLKNPGGSPDKDHQFIKFNADILSVDLFFDTTSIQPDEEDLRKTISPEERKDVRDVVQPILDLAKTRSTKNNNEPHKLAFVWGSFVFHCVIVSIDHTYDYFDSSGKALRATLAMKLRGIPPEAPLAEKPKAAATKAAKKEVVQAGQDLACFCAKPEDWSKLASFNNIDNPILYSTGQKTGETISIP